MTCKLFGRNLDPIVLLRPLKTLADSDVYSCPSALHIRCVREWVETGHFSRFCEGHKIYGIKHKTYGIKHRIGRYYQDAEDRR